MCDIVSFSALNENPKTIENEKSKIYELCLLSPSNLASCMLAYVDNLLLCIASMITMLHVHSCYVFKYVENLLNLKTT